jgi:lipopolysaccharide/colanic/teichoic acid biosynthesis glycosyltransferase
MLELDIAYVDRWSLREDLLILVRTLRSITLDWDKTA